MTKYSVLKYIFLALFNSALIYAIPLTYSYESWTLLAILFFILILVNFTYLKVKPTPLKWITPGIIFMSIFVIYPAIYNIYVSTTNWSTGHVLTKQQALDVLLNKTYTRVEMQMLRNIGILNKFKILIPTQLNDKIFSFNHRRYYLLSKPLCI